MKNRLWKGVPYTKKLGISLIIISIIVSFLIIFIMCRNSYNLWNVNLSQSSKNHMVITGIYKEPILNWEV